MIDISTLKITSLLGSITVASLFNMVGLSMPEKDDEKVRYAILQFVKAGDARSKATLDSILHTDFRVVANQLNGSNTLVIINKAQYLGLLEARKLGGDTRSVQFETIEVVENNASVRATLTGTTTVFQSFYHLVKNSSGQWLLIQDLPFVTKK